MRTHFFRTLEAFPPFLMRVLARSRGHCGLLVPDAIVAQRSGFSVVFVRELGRKGSWEGVNVQTADRFMVGCGVQHLQELGRQFRKELRRPKPFDYLHPHRYRSLLKRLQELPENHPFFKK